MTTHENHGRLWWDDRVEAHLDGSLAENESARFDRMLLTDDALSREVDIAREITDGLHSMPVVECPEHVTDAVMASVRKDLKENA